MIKTLQENFQKIQKFALLGGIVAIYLVAVGMVETFAQRNLIGTSLSLGHAFLVLGPIGVGILIAQALKESETKSIYVAGFLAGALSSVSLILFNIVIQIFVIQANPDAVFYLRNMFVNFTPTALEFLTFGQGMVLGNILLFLFFGLMGMLGVSFLRFPDKVRRGWINSLIWVLAVGLFSENV
ncbi:MAG: hypothetical protein HQ525_12440, partial [Anaerolineae bacterium]|nr:hypothetical protein [Anaerolineae bacterium]